MSPRTGSLRGRLLLGSVLLLPLFLGVSGLYLERSHRLGLEAATIERLQLQIFTLLAQADYGDILNMPGELLEPRLNQAGSGLYARVFDAWGALLWQSPSALSLAPANLRTPLPGLAPGQRRFSRDAQLFRLDYQVNWASEAGLWVPLRFSVMESTAAVDAELATYRQNLLIWLGGSAGLLLLFQLLILHWGLRPLKSLAADISAVETGERDHLHGPYPKEVQALTDNLALLLNSEAQRREKVRETMADLAHSLKTPLAILNSADVSASHYPALVREQSARMEEIVTYQLQRALSGGHRLLQPVPLEKVLQRLKHSMERVYADRQLTIDLELHPELSLRADERDLLELLGNLLDNACKYCHQRVQVCARQHHKELTITISDDGPGLPPEQSEAVLSRGIRADTRQEGQGIGLAVALDIATSYGGSLRLGSSAWGGLEVRLQLPC